MTVADLMDAMRDALENEPDHPRPEEVAAALAVLAEIPANDE